MQCWVNDQYTNIRLYAHYLWIFIAELGSVLIYTSIFFVLVARVRSGYYAEEVAKRAKSVAMLMAIYPAVYVVCTLPLASARTAAMAGRDVSLTHLVIAGAMITSNGWLDVLLYSLTRKILIFSAEPPSEDCGIATFQLPWECTSRFGTFTTIVADEKHDLERKGSVFSSLSLRRKDSHRSSLSSSTSTTIFLGRNGNPGMAGHGHLGSQHDGHNRAANFSRKGFKEKCLCPIPGMCKNKVKTETTVQVSSSPMEEADYKEIQAMEERERELATQPLDEDNMQLDFQTKPAGL